MIVTAVVYYQDVYDSYRSRIRFDFAVKNVMNLYLLSLHVSTCRKTVLIERGCNAIGVRCLLLCSKAQSRRRTRSFICGAIFLYYYLLLQTAASVLYQRTAGTLRLHDTESMARYLIEIGFTQCMSAVNYTHMYAFTRLCDLYQL